MPKMLVTRPEHDDTTFYLSAWAGLVVKEARQRGITVFDLRGEKANRQHLQSLFQTANPDIVMFNGHGSEHMITGHEQEPLIVCGENDGFLNGRVVYAVACRAALQLGPSCTSTGGCRAFLGYDDDFVFYSDTSKTSHPLLDRVARPPMEASNQVPLSLIKGNSPAEAFARAQEHFRKHIRSLIRSREPEAPYILQALIHNMTHLRFCSTGHYE